MYDESHKGGDVYREPTPYAVEEEFEWLALTGQPPKYNQEWIKL